MKLKTALLLVTGLLLAVAFAFLLRQASAPLATQHHNIIEMFEGIKRLDSRLNEDTTKLAQQLIKHYDMLESHHKTLTDRIFILKHGDNGIYGKYNAKVDEAFEQMELLFSDKHHNIERFKLHNAVLRNSLHYLPTLTDSITMKISGTYQHYELVALIERINRMLFSYVHTHDNIWRDALAKDVTKLIEKAPATNPGLAASLKNMTQHVEMAVRSASAMYISLGSSTSEVTAQGIDALYNAYNKHYEDSVQASSKYRRYLNIAAVFLAVYVLSILLILARVKKARRQEEAQLRILSSVAENATDIVYITDNEGVVEYANPGFAHATGYRREEIIGKTPRLVKSSKHDDDFYRLLWNTILSGAEFRKVFINRRKDGTLFHEDKVITPICDDKGSVTHFVSTGRDVTESVSIQEKLDYLAHHDELTSLPNRILFKDRLSHAIDRADRQSISLALMFLDLDNFKKINDTLGHDVGDALLQAAAHRLQSCVRQMDTVARLGGDEFVILLEDISQVNEVSAIARKVVTAISQPIDALGHIVNITTSIGVSIYPVDGTNADTLIKNADIAMYNVKSAGRNGYQLFNTDMVANTVE